MGRDNVEGCEQHAQNEFGSLIDQSLDLFIKIFLTLQLAVGLDQLSNYVLFEYSYCVNLVIFKNFFSLIFFIISFLIWLSFSEIITDQFLSPSNSFSALFLYPPNSSCSRFFNKSYSYRSNLLAFAGPLLVAIKIYCYGTFKGIWV